jgi:hypothetical protein
VSYAPFAVDPQPSAHGSYPPLEDRQPGTVNIRAELSVLCVRVTGTSCQLPVFGELPTAIHCDGRRFSARFAIMSNRYLDEFYGTRRRLRVGLLVAGAISGAFGGAALTVLGKIVAGAPPATVPNYIWNMVVFGVIGAVLSPVVTWSALRNAPLWRTVCEPLLAGIAAATVGVLAGSGVLFLTLAPIGVAAAILRLNYAYRTESRDRQLTEQPHRASISER